MAKLGRKPNPVPSIDWKAYIPINIATQVDLLLLDPFTGVPRKGARSALVTQLLLQWLSTQRKGVITDGLQDKAKTAQEVVGD